MRIDLDIPVSCADGPLGELADVVIDPVTRRLTHLVIAPHDGQEHARLVPIERAHEATGPEGISLNCTAAEISQSGQVHESAFVLPGEFPPAGSDWDIGIQEMFPISDFGSVGPGIMGAGMAMEYDQHVVVSYHRVPKGCVEIRRASPVASSDGHHVGHVVGFVLDDDERITLLVLEHGHLWGKRWVEIPASAIERYANDELLLSLTGDQVGELKELPSHRQQS
jgi:sporulation protein YlmC with PRC-barrel domain